MKIFDLDGPVYRVGVEIADFMILTIYWILGCLPIITIGASTSSLFYVFGKKVRGEDAYITKDFIKAYKQNFKQSIPITIILGLFWLAVIAYNIMILGYNGQAPFALLVVAMFFMIEVILMTIYSLGILSRFYMKVSNIFLTSFVLAHKHILNSLTIVAGTIVIEYAVTRVPFLFVVSPVLIIYMSSVFIQKTFTQHLAACETANQDESQGNADERADDEVEGMEAAELETIEAESNMKQDEEENKQDMQDQDEAGTTKEKEEEDQSYLKYI